MTPEEVKEWRQNFVVQGPCCKCGGLPTELHEILPGKYRKKAMQSRACVLRVCRQCHDEIQGADMAYQLALKLLSDPKGFSIVDFCNVWGRPWTAVINEDIVIHLRDILIDRGY